MRSHVLLPRGMGSPNIAGPLRSAILCHTNRRFSARYSCQILFEVPAVNFPAAAFPYGILS